MIRRRRAPITTKTGHERWLVSYSDLVTLLFAFFVMMYSVSQVNEQKYRVLSSTLADAFSGTASADVESQPAGDTTTAGGAATAIRSAAASGSEAIGQDVRAALAGLVPEDSVSIRTTEEWLEIDVDANLLFDSASAQPSAEAQKVFTRVAQVLARLPNPIEVAGHTDDVPIKTAEFASNWELSSARASAAVRILATSGVHPARMVAVGYGQYRPLTSNETAEGRASNRRVVLKVSRHAQSPSAPAARIDAVALEEQPAAPPTPDEAPSAVEQLPAPEQNPTNPQTPQPVEPVRLDHGGLLFSSDPELPRESR